MVEELEVLYTEMGGKSEDMGGKTQAVLSAVAEPADVEPVVRAAQTSA
jgi:hypothetical protein